MPKTYMPNLGKRIRGSTYLHRSATGLLDADRRGRLENAAHALRPSEWSVMRFDDTKPEIVTLLDYEPFETTAFPALRIAYTVSTDGSIVRRAHAVRNPPILHRKELMLAPDDPQRADFAALTERLEGYGLFVDMARRGRRIPWNDALAAAGLRIEKADVVPDVPAWSSARERTAMMRRGLSKPVGALIETGVLNPAMTVLDYGCGKGDDVRTLAGMGYEANGWDPFFRPAPSLLRPADVVFLSYVLNVIENETERRHTLRHAFSLARSLLVVSLLAPSHVAHRKPTPFADGMLTRRGTFQRGFNTADARALLETTLETDVRTLRPGVFLVETDGTLRLEETITAQGGRRLQNEIL